MENIRLILFAVGIIIYVSCFIDNGREMEIEEWYIYQLVKLQKIGNIIMKITDSMSENRIPYAERIGSYWANPNDAIKPKDERIKSGKYIKLEIIEI